MQVGACRLTFRLHGNDSLKGKRQVAHSLLPKLRQRFNVTAAEMDAQDEHQRLVVGIACVSNGARHVNEVLDNVISYIEGMHIDAELVDVDRETFNGV